MTDANRFGLLLHGSLTCDHDGHKISYSLSLQDLLRLWAILRALLQAKFLIIVLCNSW